jgi:response regulator RpfG family c-di-GMP phosphodiesterase
MQDAPVLFVIDDDPRTRSVVEGELCKRYGSDYRLISTESADDPLRLLARLSVDRRLVAIVLAVQWLFRMTGAQVLARVREFHPTAKRVLLADWGDLASYEPIQHAIALGQLDAYVAPPAAASAVGEGSIAIHLVHDYLRADNLRRSLACAPRSSARQMSAWCAQVTP